MRIVFVLFCGLWATWLGAQTFFPVKISNRWGLINGEGKLVIQARYEAIGDFKLYGYAVMQREGKVGMLDRQGREVVAPQYEDLRVLDSLLVAVMDQGQWMVVNLQGRIILPKGYDRLLVWEGGYLAYRQNQKWGVVNREGRSMVPAQYDEVQFKQNSFIQTSNDGRLGLYLLNGKELLSAVNEQIEILNDSLFFFRRNQLWGAIDHRGRQMAPNRFQSWRRLSDSYFIFQNGAQNLLFSSICKGIVTDGKTYDDYYPLTTRYIITRKDKTLGLIDWCGKAILSPLYDEILPHSPSVFRVNFKGQWALLKEGDQELTPFKYGYIAPPKGPVSIVKQGQDFGLINLAGKELTPARYRKITLEGNQAKAYKKTTSTGQAEALDLLRFNEAGELVADQSLERHFKVRIGTANNSNTRILEKDEAGYVLEKYEWFYAAKEDRWGLRNISDGSIQIQPTFRRIKVEPELGLTLVGMPSSKDYEFERTTYRFEYIYGLIDNNLGALVTEISAVHFFLEDFRQGSTWARCWMQSGRFGLVNRRGQFHTEDFSFIGPFQDGVARMSQVGRVSGALKPNQDLGKLQDYLTDLASPVSLADVTQYDQIFRDNAYLTCESCTWGYVDTAGQMRMKPQFAFARDFVNEVGIVQRDNKWGVVNRFGKQVIPCQYDDIHFLENTENKIIRLYVQRPKYGLIDTLGQLAVSAVYDQIGSFRENRLAVMRDGLWGFVDNEGMEIIPCRFREVSDFYEGLAAVKLGRYWGFIDKLGNVKIEFQYKRAGNFRDKLAWVESDKGIGYINAHNKMEIPAQFEQAQDFDRGIARVKAEGKWGLIDAKNRWILKPKYVDIRPFDLAGLAVAVLTPDNSRLGLINLQGLAVGSSNYTEIYPFSEGLAVVKDRDAYGYIDTTGKLVISCSYSRAEPFSEGRAAVYKDGNCGYLTREGDALTAFVFKQCQRFADGRAVVFQGSLRKAGLLDTSGKLLIEPSINRLLDFSEGRGLVRDEQYRFYYITEQAGMYNGYYQKAGSFNHGVAVVQINGKWGVINRRGMELVPPKYSRIESFENGYAKVRIDGFSGLSNLQGDLIVGADFEYIRYAGQGVFRVEQGDKIGYFDTDGNWIWTLSN